MLEPTDIHSYEPPTYRVLPPSPSEGPPPSLTFRAVVLESPDAHGGPPPALLHSLRDAGCKLILAKVPNVHKDAVEDPENGSAGVASTHTQPEKLHSQWFDAVFDKVLDASSLSRYLVEKLDIDPTQCLCYACSEQGAEAFAAANVGLIIAPKFDKVWRWDGADKTSVCTAGADVATPQSPTARQLSWLHKVYTEKFWCVCFWWSPPEGELHEKALIPTDYPTAEERAEITSVASRMMTARGHPPWSTQGRGADEAACKARLGDDLLECPDWTPMEPYLESCVGVRAWPQGQRGQRAVRSFPKILLYCHSLDVGIAQVNHALEAEDRNGVRVRVGSRRFVNLHRPGQAAAELSVTVLQSSSSSSPPPDIHIHSSLRQDHVPKGFTLDGNPQVEIEDGGRAILSAAYVDTDTGRTIEVKAFHRLIRDDGKGDVQLTLGGPEGGMRTAIKHVSQAKLGSGAVGIDVVFSNPRRGTRYTVEKVVSVTTFAPAELSQLPRPSLPVRTQSEPMSLPGGEEEPPSLPEVEEEHRSAWRSEWDKADIEISGTRKAVRCQRAARLFRYHQVSRGDIAGVGSGKGKVPKSVPKLVGELFKAAFQEVFEPAECDRPSALITARIPVQDPRSPPTIRIEPNLPPACRHLRFNAALAQRWHRFTFTSGTVKILVQGPVWAEKGQEAPRLHAGEVEETPRFTLPNEGGAGGIMRGGIEVWPWHEVTVQHALTELGRPDGSAGGFYSLMRRTRFVRMKVVKRLLADSDRAEEKEVLDNEDDTHRQILHNALARLMSVPRPPEWRRNDDEHQDLHLLEADATTQARVKLRYEKNELIRDIMFLEGNFITYDNQFPRGFLAGDDSQEVVALHEDASNMTLEDAKKECRKRKNCKGFTYTGDPKQGKVKVYFRDAWADLQTNSNWTTVRYYDGEAALEELLRSQFEKEVRVPSCPSSPSRHYQWVEQEVPSWEDTINRAVEVLQKVVEVAEVDYQSRASFFKDSSREFKDRDSSPPFKNFITDRDGTTNNYCDRYASSIQSAYNAAWLSHFAKNCAENSVFITAAPLGGRPSAEGLMELCIAPRGVFTYTGSKGREYFNHSTQRVRQAEELPQDQHELVEELHRRLLALCLEPGNAKFLVIGSGLQRKFGEVTMARNDPEHTISEPESKRFMAAVRRIKEDLDPDGNKLDLHDTGTDMEIFPRVVGGRSFDKGNGVECLNQKLQLHVQDGPNLVCGDTDSDVPMIVATLRLMCGDHMVDIWEGRIRREEEPAEQNEPEPLNGTEGECGEEAADETEEAKEQRLQEECKLKEEEDEKRKIGAKLAVLFVIPPVKAEKVGKMNKLAERVRKWCDISGAKCAILPSSDALVAALAHYANDVAGCTVTSPHSRWQRQNSMDGSELPSKVPPKEAWEEQRSSGMLTSTATGG